MTRAQRTTIQLPLGLDDIIPPGLCQCGCGQATRIARQNKPQHGQVKGQPVRFVAGHNNRVTAQRTRRYEIEDCGYETPCWIWQAYINKEGYGRTNLGNTPAHRHYFVESGGVIPAGHELHHKCGVRACVNPSHMAVVGKIEHSSMTGRAKSPLTIEQVRDIRTLSEQTPQRTIARIYGVSTSTINSIVKNRVWRE